MSRLAAEPLKLVIGVALLLFGLEWLRKGVLRLAGRRSRSSAYAEYLEERDALAAAPVDGTDWAARTVAFKGVLLEGLEVILIVTALAGPSSSRTPALLGAGLAVALTVMVGLWLHRPLRRLPETELKYGVGILLSTFGTFFVAEGLDVSWPLDDAALLLVAGVYVVASQLMVRRLRRGRAAGRAAGEHRMTFLRQLRLLVLGETSSLPLGVAAAVGLAAAGQGGRRPRRLVAPLGRAPPPRAAARRALDHAVRAGPEKGIGTPYGASPLAALYGRTGAHPAPAHPNHRQPGRQHHGPRAIRPHAAQDCSGCS